jgi:glycosyltransferase involved in cell wall biosynthesis
MRVMQVMAGAQHGGAEAFFVRHTIALAQAGVETRAVIRPFAHRREALAAGGVPVAELPFGSWFDFRTRPRLAAEIDAFKPDIVLSWMNRGTHFVPRPARDDGRAPFVHVGRLGGYYSMKYYRNCDHLIGNTRDIVDYIVRSGWPAGRAHYLPNFAEETSAPAVPRASLQTPDGVPLFLALGRLHVNKGFDVLLDAVAMQPEAWLWLAGEGPLRRSLTAQAERLGIAHRVRFLGWRQDVAALMAASDALICSSRHEPLGNVVIEAWIHALPVIATDSQGPAALIQSGRTGLLVPREDAGALAAAMARIAGDRALAAALAQAGRAAYLERFSRQAVVDRYLAFFDRITATRNPERPRNTDGATSRTVTGPATQG